MKKSELIRIAIKNCTDEAELAKLEKELVKAIEEEALVKAKAELAEENKKAEEAKKALEAEETKKEVKEAQSKSMLGHIPDGSIIKVGTPQLYNGYNLKAAIDQMKFSNNNMVRAISRRDEDAAEKVSMFMIDLLNRSVKGSYQKAMNEGTDSAGGYLTPTEQRMAVLSYVREMSIAMQDCQHISMNSDSMTMPRENGKVTVSYTSEASDATATSATFAQVTLTATRMDAYVDVSNELINDAGTPGGIAGLLASQFLEAVGQKVDSTVFLGTGSPVSGVFLTAGTSEVFDSGSTNFSEVRESDLRAVIAKISPSSRGNAKWYISTSGLWNDIKGIKDSNGRPLYDDYTAGQIVEGMLLGKPVREGNDNIMKSTSAASTALLVFGDLSGFVIGDRLTNVTLMEDPYSLSTSYQTRFLLFTRWAYAHGLPNNYTRLVTAAS